MKKNSIFARVCMIITLIFMYAPILVLIVFSFNDSKSRTVWTGFSFHWYTDLFSDTRILKSLATTLEVSVLAMIIATILGTAAAVGFASMRRKPRSIVMAINSIPMTNADIITGVSLMMLFVFAFGAFNSTIGEVFGITPVSYTHLQEGVGKDPGVGGQMGEVGEGDPPVPGGQGVAQNQEQGNDHKNGHPNNIGNAQQFILHGIALRIYA